MLIQRRDKTKIKGSTKLGGKVNRHNFADFFVKKIVKFIAKYVVKNIWVIMVLLFVVLPRLLSGISNLAPKYAEVLSQPANALSVIKSFNIKEFDIRKLDIGRKEEAPKKDDDEMLNCANLTEYWRPDENIYFDGNKIKLKNGGVVGSVFFKDKVSNFLNFEIIFKSSLKNGINTNISFLDKYGGELRYSVGDGDFKTVRSFYLKDLVVEENKELILLDEINNDGEVGFKIDIVEQKNKSRALSSLTYYDRSKKFYSLDFKDMTIPRGTYLSVGFGLDAKKELAEEEPYIEIKSCALKENTPSKILN